MATRNDPLGFYRLLASFPTLGSYRAKFVAVLVVAFGLPLFLAWVVMMLGAGRMSLMTLAIVLTGLALLGCAFAIWAAGRLLAPLDRALQVLEAYVDGETPARLDLPGTDTAAQIARGLAALAGRVRANEDAQRVQTERDSLTGLWNRMTGRKQGKAYLDDAIKRGRTVRILVADIDRFAELNADHGAIACDLVLKTYATRLVRSAGDDSVVIRWDGDRFVLMQSAIDADFPAVDDVVARAIIVKGQDAPVMLSIGAAQTDEKGVSFDALLGRAEADLRAVRAG